MMHRLSVAAAVVAVAGALVPAPARAKSITMSVSPTVEVQDGTLTAHVKLNNSGDDVAQSVTPILRFRDQEKRGETKAALGPNQSVDETISVPAGELTKGRWPFRLVVDYTDANQYPFQAVHVGLLTIGDAPVAKLAIPEVKAEPLAGSGAVQVKMKNLAGTARQVTVATALPEAIEATKAEQRVDVDRWADAAVTFPVVNRTALAGSRFPVFVTAEYDEDGAHQTVVGVGTLDVVAAQSRLLAGRMVLWIVAGVLVVGWLGYLLARTVGRPRGAAPRA